MFRVQGWGVWLVGFRIWGLGLGVMGYANSHAPAGVRARDHRNDHSRFSVISAPHTLNP